MSDNRKDESKKPKQNECLCASPRIAESTILPLFFPKNFTQTSIIDFGEVLPGCQRIKYLDLKNSSDQAVTYYIQRISFVNQLYQTFHFNKYNMTANPQSNFQLKITYIPLLENEKSCDIFRITAGDSGETRDFRLFGKCLGTRVKCSTKNLYFFVTPIKKKKINTFELINVSEAPAIFQFEVNENDELFVVDTINGQIPARKSVYISVTFHGKIEGIHYRKLVILFYKHEPLMINLIAECSKNRYIRENSVTIEDQSTYNSYFNDYKLPNENSRFKFNHDYIDFGRVLPESLLNSNPNSHIAVGIFNNKTQHEVEVTWYKDPLNIFFIHPNKLRVDPEETGYFELSFKPNFRDHIYHRKMTGQIHCGNTKRPSTPIIENCEEEQHIPLEIDLIMIGHSFPENTSWISSIELYPKRMIFPVCLPGSKSYTTFMLKSDGHLPLLFKFIAPEKSLITVKPMMGLMRFTKLFVARLSTQERTVMYKEEWRIEINGEPQRNCNIIFLGQSEIPSVQIGTDNTIKFNATLPGCQDIIHVPIKNTSPYRLRLDFKITQNEYFDVRPRSLELHQNEEATTEWIFKSKLDVPERTEIHCVMRVISNTDEIIGLPYETLVYLEASSEYSQLCAIPRYVDFGDIPWGATKEVQFKIFNFGQSEICYKLKALTVSGVPDDITISIAMGKLEPQGNKMVCVSFKAQTNGGHVVQIVYHARINEFEEVESSYPPVDLFSIKYNSIYPTIQIEECVEHDLGKMFSKLDMWNFFSINTINDELTQVKEGERKVVKVILPTLPCQEKKYYIRFVMRNITKFEVTVTLSRVKMCNCPAMEISKGLSFRQKVFKCPHRNMLQMKLSNETIHANSFQFLDIMMNFNLITHEEIAYDMKLGGNRYIQFRFEMNSIPSNSKKLLVYNSENHKRFLNMFIGAKEPPYQTVWLYNPTSQETTYQLIDEKLEDLNSREGFSVISCFNNKGCVAPFSSKALLFRFHPIEAKKYQITLPLILGDEIMSLTLSGTGIYKYDSDLIHNLKLPMPQISMQTGEFPISLSADYVVVQAFSVWNTTAKLIYLKNLSKERVMEYTLDRSFMEEVIEIIADKPNGLIHPDEMVPILLNIKSFNMPVISNINMLCKIIDVTQNEKHEQSKRKYEERQKQIEDYFIIDERGIRTMNNNLKIEPPSEVKYITFSITFHTISTIELCHYLDVDQFFGQNPFESFQPKLRVSSNEKDSEINETWDPFISQILECFVMDTLKNQIFKEMVQCQQIATPPFYLQLKQNDDKKSTEQHKRFVEFPMRNLSDTFKVIIKESLQQMFL